MEPKMPKAILATVGAVQFRITSPDSSVKSFAEIVISAAGMGEESAIAHTLIIFVFG